MDSTILLYFGVLLLLVCTFALAFLAAAFHRLVTEVETLKEHQHGLNARSHHKAERIFEQAQNKSLEIIAESEQKAEQIINQADFFSGISQDEISKQLQKASQEQIQAYSRLMQELRGEIGKMFETVSADIQNNTLDQVEKFRKDVSAKTLETENMLGGEMKQEYQKVSLAIESYKENMMKKIDETTYSIVKQVTESVLHRGSSAADHEHLVIQALEEAKRQHVF
jgi:exonuclease VII large subunit